MASKNEHFWSQRRLYQLKSWTKIGTENPQAIPDYQTKYVVLMS
jgi:hypothetical protein